LSIGKPEPLQAVRLARIDELVPMVFDASTLFAVNVAVTSANALLLFWCWLQNRAERSLLWISVGYFAAASGNVLLASRDSMPSFVAVDLANALIIYGLGMIWVVVRVFNGRPAPQWIPLTGVALWLLAVRLPAIADSNEWRIVLSSAIIASYCVIGAWDLWVRDGLKSRFPIALTLAAHATAVSVRIPVALIEARRGVFDFGSPWFTPMALETLVFVQVLALLMLSLTKERAEARLSKMALTDPLTGLANRRAFFDQGARLVAQGQRLRRPTSLIAFDLDRFKQVNDTYGHPFGDAVLEAFAIAVQTGLRAGDLAGRIGGEEFAAVLPGADEDEAKHAADRVIEVFAETVGVTEADRERLTTSAGLAVSPVSAESLEALFAAADRALYVAKRGGGNQLRVAASTAA
jgi:diguanylate cyclase (GGDEF)-like protein